MLLILAPDMLREHAACDPDFSIYGLEATITPFSADGVVGVAAFEHAP